jgi:hypothetical protein
MVAEEESCMRGVFFQAALLSLSFSGWAAKELAVLAVLACCMGNRGPLL